MRESVCVCERERETDGAREHTHTHSLSLSLSHTHTYTHTQKHTHIYTTHLLTRHPLRSREIIALFTRSAAHSADTPSASSPWNKLWVCVCVYVCVREREEGRERGRESVCVCVQCSTQRGHERWGAGVETQKNVRGEIGGWGRVPFNEIYAPSLSTIYDGA